METNIDALPKSEDTTKTINSQWDHSIIVGYIFLSLSFLLFALFEWFIDKENRYFFTIFMVHYFLALAYLVHLIYNKAFGVIKSWRQENISKTIILINLFLLSAYALNRDLSVFEDSTNWLCVYLLITSLTLLSYQYYYRLPRWVNNIQHLILGSACVLYFYQVLYVANFYVVGIIGIILFGVGGHILVPLVLLTGIIFLIRYYGSNKSSYLWLFSGFLITVLFVVGFIIEWSSRVTKIDKIVNQSVMYSNDEELPIWVRVSQSVPTDWITQRILKSDLVYTIPSRRFGSFIFLPETATWDEKRKHDPLVFLASLNAECSLTRDDRVKILRVILDSRHKSNERLWNGDNLTTSYIVSDIDIYPDLRLAYTEKYLNIKNHALKGQWRGSSEEAIYTFQLPEGSVVTSLSLWINGKEEKGILTSKQKATTAYKTIVGVESRDPSVVHWQEGNTVTVRIFPCTKEEERKFKIGITTPLTENEGTIHYRNISFLGPDPTNAQETIRVRFLGASGQIEMPSNFTKDNHGDYVSEQHYNPDFEIPVPPVPLKDNNTFAFDGFSYSMIPYEPIYQPLAVKQIYLDINNTWTDKEIIDLSTLKESVDFYVYSDNAFIKLTNKNWDLIDEFRKRNFSLFPFHHVKDLNHSLVITKGKPLSPHLIDVKESKFANGIRDFFTLRKKVFVYNLDNNASTYINSLREFRGLQYASGSTNQLLKWLKDHKYPRQIENENRVVLHNAKLVINREKITEEQPISNAPDHLARLFAYNHIMQQIGISYFDEDYSNEQLVDEATTAYIVSPVSSLIVLETQEDYERFDIHDKNNSLQNASKQSSGAVPEPHEWALIILFALFVIYVRLKHFG